MVFITAVIIVVPVIKQYFVLLLFNEMGRTSRSIALDFKRTWLSRRERTGGFMGVVIRYSVLCETPGSIYHERSSR